MKNLITIILLSITTTVFSQQILKDVDVRGFLKMSEIENASPIDENTRVVILDDENNFKYTTIGDILSLSNSGATGTEILFSSTTDIEEWGYGAGIVGGRSDRAELYTNGEIDYKFIIPAGTIKENGDYIKYNCRFKRTAGAGIWHASLKLSTDDVNYLTKNERRFQYPGNGFGDTFNGRIILNDNKIEFADENGNDLKTFVTEVSNTEDLYLGVFGGTDDLVTRHTVEYCSFELIKSSN